MPWSSGTFSRVHDWTTDEGASLNIEASRMDSEDDNFRDGINDCLHKGGQNTPTGSLPMGGNRHTGVGNANALTNYASATDVIAQNLTYYVDTGAADAYVITPSPAISAYAEGQRFVFRAANANTGTSTLNVNALGTRIIYTPDGTALAAGQILAGGYYEVVYDANTDPDRWILMSPSSISNTIRTFKDTDTERTNTTTETADPDLASMPMEADTLYEVEVFLVMIADSVDPDIDFRLDFSQTPQTPSFIMHGGGVSGVSTTFTLEEDATTALTLNLVDTAHASYWIKGHIHSNASTGGTVGIQWAQSTLDAADGTILKRGSYMKLTKLGADAT